LRALDLSGDVFKTHVEDTLQLVKLGCSLRQDALKMACLSGACCHEVQQIADKVDGSVERSGCADMLVRRSSEIVVYDTTYAAFLEVLSAVPSPRSTAVVIGAGPAACAAVGACRELGFQIVGVTSRSWISTEVLHESVAAEELRELGALPTMWPFADSAIESTKFSREMRLQFRELTTFAQTIIQTVAVDPSSSDILHIADIVPWDKLRKDTIVCDLVCGSKPSPFMLEAQKRGLTGIAGVDMLTTRGLRMMETWKGRRPPRAPVLAAAVRASARTRDE
jgi:shikimate dehydrogenase